MLGEIPQHKLGEMSLLLEKSLAHAIHEVKSVNPSGIETFMVPARLVSDTSPKQNTRRKTSLSLGPLPSLHRGTNVTCDMEAILASLELGRSAAYSYIEISLNTSGRLDEVDEIRERRYSRRTTRSEQRHQTLVMK